MGRGDRGGVADVALSTEHAEAAGDLVNEIGAATLSAGAAALVGKQIFVWKQEDDAWRQHRDVWILNA